MKKAQKPMKIAIIVIAVLAAIALAVGGAVLAYYYLPISYGETQTHTVGDGKTLKVGVISDTQLAPNESDGESYQNYEAHLHTALSQLKEQQVEMVLFAGDICDNASKHAYHTYQTAIRDTWPDEASRPVFLNIMGNHDLWFESDYWSVPPKHRLFQKQMGTNPYIHMTVNGAHFIGVSPDKTQNKDGYSQKALDWMDAEIQKAQETTPKGKPIFVITHHNPQNTSYGSDVWYDGGLDGVLSKYENVVSISGHSHYSIFDERAIMQTTYTSFTTQSLAYIELETGNFDAFKDEISSIPPHDEAYPAMLIIQIGENKTDLIRWNIADNAEEKPDNRWVLNYPLTKGNFEYSYNQRLNATSNPYFEADGIAYDGAIPTYLKEGVATLPGISFPAAKDDDLVQHYEVRLVDEAGNQYFYTYFSDFYSGKESMSETVKIALDRHLASGKYKVTVTAVDSFGNYSKTNLEGEIDYVQPLIDEKSPDSK